MTEAVDPSAFRHATVYRTVRGLTLSGGREAGGAVRAVAQPPVRISEIVRVQRGTDLDLVDTDDTAPDAAPVQDDSAGLYELRRYSEPND